MISSSFWMVECDPFLCIITPQALESSKRSQDHRENSTHTQAPPTSASAAFSNDVLVKRKPLGPPLCLFFWARITTTIVYSKNIHVSQYDGTATIFHLCLILTTILCRNNIHLCLILTSTFQFMSSTSDQYLIV